MVGRSNITPELNKAGPPLLGATVARRYVVDFIESEYDGPIELTECRLKFARSLGKGDAGR